MRAVRFAEFGEPNDVLTLEEMPMPEPGKGQVRLRVTHRPINPSDLETIRGRYGRLPTLPGTPGMEAVGVIDALGKGVRGFQLGQRVVPTGIGGSWREYVLVDAALLVPVPEAMADGTAAQLVGNPITAWVVMTDVLSLKPGDWLLQTAAGSTLGRMVIQMAHMLGIKTINLVRRAEQCDELLALGGDAAFATSATDLVAKIRELTGRGATAGLDSVGGETGLLALNSLAPGGTLIALGMLSNEPIPVLNGELLFRGTGIRGFWLNYWFRSTPPEQIEAVLTRLVTFMSDGRLQAPVEATYDLADVAAAVAHAERPGRSGKVLLTG